MNVLFDYGRVECLVESNFRQYQCHNTGYCVPSTRVGNGINDCGDCSDEPICSKLHFYCFIV